MLTAERARELFAYDPDTGLITRKITVNRNAKAGDTVDRLSSNGYLRVDVNKRSYYAHRLVWLIMTGEWPVTQIDHINTVRIDNRWPNLREATRSENMQNTKMRQTNKSGFKGVSWARANAAWVAFIGVRGKKYNLGYRGTPEAAYALYVAASKELHKEFGRLA